MTRLEIEKLLEDHLEKLADMEHYYAEIRQLLPNKPYGMTVTQYLRSLLNN